MGKLLTAELVEIELEKKIRNIMFLQFLLMKSLLLDLL